MWVTVSSAVVGARWPNWSYAFFLWKEKKITFAHVLIAAKRNNNERAGTLRCCSGGWNSSSWPPAGAGGLLGEQPMRSWIALHRVEGLTGWGSCGISLDDVNEEEDLSMMIFFVTFCSISSSSITLMMIQILTFSIFIISFGKFCPPNAPSAVYFQSNSPRTFDSSNKHLSDATKITKFESSNCEKCALILLISSAFKWILTSFQADARQNKSNQSKCVQLWSRRAVFGVA